MKRFALRTTATICCVFALSTAAFSDCAEYDGFTGAVAANDYDVAVDLFEAIDIDPSCDDALRAWGSSYLARESFIRAIQTGDDPAAKKTKLLQALSYEEHWRTYAELGHLAWSAEDHTEAALYYQKSINRLVDGPSHHKAASEEIAEIYQLATVSVALAGEAVDVPKTRSGKPGGIFAGSIRGFIVEEVSLPVTYEFGETEFDDHGSLFAEKLADHLKQIGAERVTLVGHTDPVGSEESNLTLSIRRAEALGEFLAKSGFEGEIIVDGMGESSPPNLLPSVQIDEEEFFRMSRRVVFSLG